MRSIIEISLETAMRKSEILRIDLDLIEGQTLKIPIAKTEPRIIPLTKKALSLIKNAVFHDCRRNALTNFMKDKGLNVPETMKIAGHSDPRMLLRIYNNLQAHHVAKKLNS